MNLELSKDYSIRGVKSLFRQTSFKIAPWYRPSSYPFISGDTFRNCADEIIDVIQNQQQFNQTLRALRPEHFIGDERRYVLFVDLSIHLIDGCEGLLLDYLEMKHNVLHNRIILIFHNGDKTPSQSFFIKLSQLGVVSFATDMLDGVEGVTPIPQGLENRFRGRNGIMRPYLRRIDKECGIEEEINRRERSFFSCFKVETNPIERTAAREVSIANGVWGPAERIEPKQYRNIVNKSLFVISPPGNGIDCHRTWESIYLGAVPVVKRGFLADSLSAHLPILVVNEWEEVFSLDRRALEDLYFHIRSVDRTAAYFDYWQKTIDASRFNVA